MLVRMYILQACNRRILRHVSLLAEILVQDEGLEKTTSQVRPVQSSLITRLDSWRRPAQMIEGESLF